MHIGCGPEVMPELDGKRPQATGGYDACCILDSSFDRGAAGGRLRGGAFGAYRYAHTNADGGLNRGPADRNPYSGAHRHYDSPERGRSDLHVKPAGYQLRLRDRRQRSGDWGPGKRRQGLRLRRQRGAAFRTVCSDLQEGRLRDADGGDYAAGAERLLHGGLPGGAGAESRGRPDVAGELHVRTDRPAALAQRRHGFAPGQGQEVPSALRGHRRSGLFRRRLPASGAVPVLQHRPVRDPVRPRQLTVADHDPFPGRWPGSLADPAADCPGRRVYRRLCR